jgi:opacity protein-like surface antigen
MRIGLLAVGAASLLLLGAPASAQAEDEEPSADFARDGWYVGVHGVYGVEDWENPGGTSVSNAWGIGARVGYRFLEYWALEFEYERILQFRVDAP